MNHTIQNQKTILSNPEEKAKPQRGAPQQPQETAKHKNSKTKNKKQQRKTRSPKRKTKNKPYDTVCFPICQTDSRRAAPSAPLARKTKKQNQEQKVSKSKDITA